MNRLFSRKHVIIMAIVATILILPLFILALFSHPTKKATTTSTNTPNASATNSSNTGSSTNNSNSTSSAGDITVPTNPEILQTLAQQSPQSGEIATNTTVNTVTDLGQGWFSASLQPNAGGDGGQVLFKQKADGSLQLVEGPGTAFAKSVLDADNVPTAVQDQLLVYNDD